MAPVGRVPPASPSTYIETGTVASETLGANVAPTMAPVAKITAEFAPVSACAAASRITLERARTSPDIPSATAIIDHRLCHPARPPSAWRHYEGAQLFDQPAQTGVRHASLVRRINSSDETPGSDCWPASRQFRPAKAPRLPPVPLLLRRRAHPIRHCLHEDLYRRLRCWARCVRRSA